MAALVRAWRHLVNDGIEDGNASFIGRGGPWGNYLTAPALRTAAGHQRAVDGYWRAISSEPATLLRLRTAAELGLRGKRLTCPNGGCQAGLPCHGWVLAAVANCSDSELADALAEVCEEEGE